jgi:hypothetical protein
MRIEEHLFQYIEDVVHIVHPAIHLVLIFLHLDGELTGLVVDACPTEASDLSLPVAPREIAIFGVSVPKRAIGSKTALFVSSPQSPVQTQEHRPRVNAL